MFMYLVYVFKKMVNILFMEYFFIIYSLNNILLFLNYVLYIY